MINVIMSGEFPEIERNLAKYGFNIIHCDKLSYLHSFESTHADLQALKINDTLFIHKDSINLKKQLNNLNIKYIETEKSLSKKYPNNVLLNCVYFNNKLYCKENSIDTTVKEYCLNNNIDIINVNQGYTKCSTTVFENLFVTADKGIYEAITGSGGLGYSLEAGGINLTGVEYGFIGGCSFTYGDNIFFTGDVTTYKGYDIIKKIAKKLNKNIVCLSNNKLYDIGGFVVV